SRARLKRLGGSLALPLGGELLGELRRYVADVFHLASRSLVTPKSRLDRTALVRIGNLAQGVRRQFRFIDFAAHCQLPGEHEVRPYTRTRGSPLRPHQRPDRFDTGMNEKPNVALAVSRDRADLPVAHAVLELQADHFL